MNRVTLIRNEAGERVVQPHEYPLSVGGGQCEIVLPGVEEVVAHIGADQGHPFIQPAAGGPEVWHNYQRLSESAWLKSGDLVQIGDSLIRWQVQGDRIVVSLGAVADTPVSPMAPPGPPAVPPPPFTGDAEEAPDRLHRLGRWSTGLLFLALLLAATFVMLATPVTLKIEPEPEAISLLGLLPVVPLPGRILALPGNYTLTAQRAGYRALEQQVAVAYGSGLVLSYRLKKLPGLVRIRSTPAGASLQVDGAASGETPVDSLELAPGQHTLRLEAERYQPLEFALEVTGMGQLQELDLTLRPDWAAVTLATDPPGAEIREAGGLLGVAPDTLELREGEHRLQFALKGYQPHTERVAVQAGVAAELPLIRLTPADALLRLATVPPGSMVRLDGEFLGTTPLELPLSPGAAHAIDLSKAGYQSQQHSFTLAAEEQKAVEIRLQPEYGVVFITSQPADASLYVDGQPRGQATARLKLPARAHQIEIKKPGFVSQRATITPAPGSSRNLDVVLTPLGARAGMASAVASAGGSGSNLVLINPEGPFTMGASRREPGRRANENLRRVELTRSYYIGRREVTNAEFRRFQPGHDSGQANGASLNGDAQPVVNVSWDEAASYVNWLSRREGLPPAYREDAGKMVLIRPVSQGYRLPSEAEWAYAARFAKAGGRARKFPWPEDRPLPPRIWGNYADTSARAQLSVVMEGYHDGYPVSASVASFAPNEPGMYDLDGNAAEWVQDYYTVYPGGVEKTARDPLGPESGRHHVVRGSSWRDAGLSELRLSYRDYSEKPRNDLGFRVARYAQ